MEAMSILILSDGRAGHLNQSIAYAKYLGAKYEIVNVVFKYKFFKNLSYLLDFFKIYTESIFNTTIRDFSTFNYIVSTGSSTYYLNKTFAKKYNLKSIALMLPHGFRYDFDYIYAQSHDKPPKQSNIIEMDANFSYSKPLNLYEPLKKSVAIIIGGQNSVYSMNVKEIKEYLDSIFNLFYDYEIAVTSSPRTSKEIENLLDSYEFAYKVIFSQNRVNPIADFLSKCDYVFITADSTSMISEAVGNGSSNIEVLPLATLKDNKFTTFVQNLENGGYLHLFNGKVSKNSKKIDFKKYIRV